MLIKRVYFRMGNWQRQFGSQLRVVDLLQEGTTKLQDGGIAEPRLNAEWLLSNLLRKRRAELYIDELEKPTNSEVVTKFRALIERRLQQEPLQYLTGETEFMSLPFKVTPAVLIPRPDTEILVEHTLQAIPPEKAIKILDIGTGCGNIAISLAHYRPQVAIVAVDVAPEAIRLAKENAKINKVEKQIRFLVADVLSENFVAQFDSKFDFVVSNPPYISEKEFSALPIEVRQFEPAIALQGGDDGLTFHRRIAMVTSELLTSGGQLFLEVGYNQSQMVQRILKKSGFCSIKTFQDLAGIERVVTGVVS